ncbi:LytR/AlgR family response regulator transcription factor [Luteibaculum oceani]|uniref:Response regulator transcription factor n=1 Tax=Luteibaculum oceani TaxID=1294296 RepID=A0A5C6UQT8_9FLAO|nr:LytTR family DNA-binding domain-containing protein [Luteibaculum oceani]TXC75567.1 response regulator transcription factor [Luteibaculum oceani]
MRTLIVDDERLARQELKKLLSQYDNLDIIGEAANGEEAAEKINAEKPDLVFLDIQMPGKSGFDLLEDLDHIPYVIFVTAYDEYAIKAFEVNALDYLLKPVENHRLEEALKKVEHRLSEDRSHAEESTSTNEDVLNLDNQIFLKDGDKCWFVSLSDVRLFESEGNYVRVYFKDKKPLILKSLNNLEKRLDPSVFFRTNRKFIVNLRWVESVETWFNGGLQLELKDGTKVEVSRRQAAKFKDVMSL